MQSKRGIYGVAIEEESFCAAMSETLGRRNISWRIIHALTICLTICFLQLFSAEAFVSNSFASTRAGGLVRTTSIMKNDNTPESDVPDYSRSSDSQTRRGILRTASVLIATHLIPSAPASAEVGTLPEFSDTNAILQGLTVNVADASQQEAMIKFLENGFDCKVLRKRIRGNVEETWMGFGPEQLSIPDSFQIPVSAFAEYGGHASICIRYDSSTTAPLYRQGDDAPGDNIAYLQLGVPGYRISQMVANGGKILDAYGLVNVVSPAGLPIRGIVGISPDPIMFVAVNCKDIKASRAFYEQLGFVETDVPYSRPSMGTTLFEPAPPKGSVYMSPSKNCMGILLLPYPNKRKTITTNPVVESLNIVYKPATSDDVGTSNEELMLTDPSNLSIKFQSVSDFIAQEKVTR
ncbi:hypothetical protein IV203_013871 [Nitzschia inconspicua]|uniref:Uncharacterized protein n=1 Tax=Nitzschia inconspicua TaxID=303405 RepID=A0A9K3M9B3_9STRA|nr:hypothetical protein IV203_013871 [Nitzschia inconspicua]